MSPETRDTIIAYLEAQKILNEKHNKMIYNLVDRIEKLEEKQTIPVKETGILSMWISKYKELENTLVKQERQLSDWIQKFEESQKKLAEADDTIKKLNGEIINLTIEKDTLASHIISSS